MNEIQLLLSRDDWLLGKRKLAPPTPTPAWGPEGEGDAQRLYEEAAGC